MSMTNDDIKAIIARCLNQGMSLSDVQDLLKRDHGCRLTYLELRLLAAEAEVDWKSMDPVPEATAQVENDAGGGGAAGGMGQTETVGTTRVTVSKLVRPGAAMSGEVTFGSGAHAEWFLDSYGRLGLERKQGEPTQDDIVEFQEELQRQLSGGAI